MARDPHEGEFADTTEVVLIRPPRPGSSRRTDLFVSIFNEDTVAVDLEVYLFSGTARHNIFKGTLAADERFRWSSKSGEDFELDEPYKSIRGVLGAAVTTNQPTWYANWDER